MTSTSDFVRQTSDSDEAKCDAELGSRQIGFLKLPKLLIYDEMIRFNLIGSLRVFVGNDRLW